jgi:hypothetical protein
MLMDVMIQQDELEAIVDRMVLHHRSRADQGTRYDALRRSHGFLNMLENYARRPEIRDALLPDIHREIADYIQEQGAARRRPSRTFAVLKWASGLAMAGMIARGCMVRETDLAASGDWFVASYVALLATCAFRGLERIAYRGERLRYVVEREDVQAALDAYASRPARQGA